MITHEIHEEGIIVVRASGTLTMDDLAGITGLIDAHLEKHDHLRGILIHTEEFPEVPFPTGSAQKLLPFIKGNYGRIHRVAFASDAPLVRMLPVFDPAFPLSSGPPHLRAFAYDAAEDALQWLKGDQDQRVARTDPAR